MSHESRVPHRQSMCLSYFTVCMDVVMYTHVYIYHVRCIVYVFMSVMRVYMCVYIGYYSILRSYTFIYRRVDSIITKVPVFTITKLPVFKAMSVYLYTHEF
jgi:hypothetical protein